MDDAELMRRLRETDPWDSPSVAAECLAEATDRIEALAAQIELWRTSRRETFDAMCAMRDSINEHIPMPSLESDLLQGPEDSVFCATVAEAVINHVSAHAALISERDAARIEALIAQRDAAVPADLEEAGKMAYECFEAVSGEGPRAYDWTDKPHRLVYDMYGTIRSLIALATAQAALIAERDAARDAALKGKSHE